MLRGLLRELSRRRREVRTITAEEGMAAGTGSGLGDETLEEGGALTKTAVAVAPEDRDILARLNVLIVVVGLYFEQGGGVEELFGAGK